jgi:hypothetical protein
VLRSFFAPSERVRLLYADTGAASYATFSGEWGSLRVRLMGEPFPPYRMLLEQPEAETLTVDRAAMLAATSRALLLGTAPLNLRWNGEALDVDNDLLTYQESLDAESDGFEVRAHAGWLRASLEKAQGERLRLVMRGAMLCVYGDGAALHGAVRMR